VRPRRYEARETGASYSGNIILAACSSVANTVRLIPNLEAVAFIDSSCECPRQVTCPIQHAAQTQPLHVKQMVSASCTVAKPTCALGAGTSSERFS